jgi:hypothetical protein
MSRHGKALLLVWLVWCVWPVQGTSQEMEAYVAARKMPLSVSQRRIASCIRQAVQMLTQHGVASPRSLVPLHQDGTIEAYIYTTGYTPAQGQTLEQHGVRIYYAEARSGIVYASVAAGALDTVAALPFVRWIGPPATSTLRVGSVTSKGDTALRADEARAMFGIDGSGVRVGIISDSLINDQVAIDSGDLPPDLLIVNGQDGSTIASATDEGRAVAEIVHDLAPGATLLFHTGFPTSLNTIQAIQALVGEGVDVLMDDIGFFAEPVFEEGPVAQAVRDAIENGVVYVTAAGNAADRHYRAVYREFDPNDNNPDVNLHDFGAGDPTMSITIPAGSSLLAVLHWANPFDGSGSDDYDLLIFDADGVQDACLQPGLVGICASTDDQRDTAAPPQELVSVQNVTGSPLAVTLLINRVAGNAVPLAINFARGVILDEHNVASGSMFGHPCVRAALALGAVDAEPDFDTNPIEDFSSQGPCVNFFPTVEYLHKPDGVAPDGVSTSLARFDPFFGTSAAVPHTAALVALLIEAAGGHGTLSHIRIANILRLSAVDRGSPGPDHVFGHGAFDAVAAVQALQTSQGGTNAPPQSIIDSPAEDMTVALGSSVVFQGTCLDADDDGPYTFAWDFGGAVAASNLQDPGGLSFNTLGVFPISFTCTDADGAPDPTPARRTVTVSRAPVSRITKPTGNITITPGDTLDFAGACRDADDDLPFSFLWFFGGGAAVASSTQQNPAEVRFDTVGTFTVTFMCIDALGLADPHPVTVQVQVRATQDSGGGGGCGAFPGGIYTSVHPLEAFGNILLPLMVLLAMRTWYRYRRRGRENDPCASP